jgi:8-oxo-dGTP pyrophosphatase MutT (NUDIX family)
VSPVISERSAGGVMLVRLGPQVLVPLIHLRRGDVLGLPKGHIEAGEEPSQTAVRETREETGLSGRVLAPLEEIEYGFWSRALASRVVKTVGFWLLEYRSGSPDHHDGEVDGVRLLPIGAAPDALTYPGERRVMQAALAWVDAAGYGAGGATRPAPPG